jgi:bacterioferritin
MGSLPRRASRALEQQPKPGDEGHRRRPAGGVSRVSAPAGLRRCPSPPGDQVSTAEYTLPASGTNVTNINRGIIIAAQGTKRRPTNERFPMKGVKEVIDVLNEVLAAELVAINQYFLHAKMCKNWGFEALAQKAREESIGEMKHADAIIERILFLEGLPNLQRLDKLHIGQTVPEQLKVDLELEYGAVTRLNNAITLCREKNDNTTEALLTKILISEEDHIDWLEAQLKLIELVGEQAYLAEQIRG